MTVLREYTEEQRKSASQRTREWRQLNLERAREYDRARYGVRRVESMVANQTKQLQRGEQIRSASNHHQGMTGLKALLGDPRPEGLTLSLVGWDSPDAYWGWDHGRDCAYRLSTNPADYAWETQAENNARKAR